MKRLLAAFAVLTALAVVAGGLFATPASAAPVAPVLDGPSNGGALTSNPVLVWEPVVDAVRYRVQISTSSSFGSTVVNTTTYNTEYTPPNDLAQTTLYWRVQGIDSSNANGDWSDVWSFDKNAASSPVPVAPTSAHVFTFPDEPLAFSWQPLSGIKNYEIQIDTEPLFTVPITVDVTTPNTSYTSTAPQTMDQTYYWRVRGLSPASVPTLWSDPIDYSSHWPDVPQLLGPPNVNSPTIEEVVLSWTPVDGADTYDVQVSPNGDFTNNLAIDTNVKSTQFSPTTTLDNGAYFWRVRAKNVANGTGGWSAIHTFTRSWPAPNPTDPPTADPPPNCVSTNDFTVVELCTPANGTIATQPLFVWTPVRLTSAYQLQVSPNQFFTSPVKTYSTDHTTYTVPSSDLSAGTYYWRVKPIDAPGSIQGLYSATGTFTYQPDMVSLTTPSDGAAVSMPLLSWVGNPGPGNYTVTVMRANDTVALTADVSNTYFVPQGLDPGDGPFTWSVQEDGGPIPDVTLARTFSLVAPASTGASPNPLPPPDAGGVYAPTLTWSAVTNATHYDLLVKGPSDGSFTSWGDATNLDRAGYAYSGYDLESGTWQWKVRAFDGATLLAEGDVGTFYVLGAGSTQLLSPSHCPPSLACDDLFDTPTLRWNPIPGATTYTLTLANDINFTNLVNGYGSITTNNTSYTPPTSLLDSQAGQAIYWYARPTGAVVGPEAGSFATDANSPVRAFRKKSVAVSLVSPADNATFANQPTFVWQDYLRTNQASTPKVAEEAKQYRIQVSTAADFSNIIDTAVVDQTTYTPFNKTYPDGPLYWRVQAIDNTSNSLTWSGVRLLTKTSPIPNATTPANGASVGAVPLLTWDTQPYASKYEVEIYKNPFPDDQGVVAGNRVFDSVTAYTASIPTGNLPAGTYGWRLRRLDADDRPGPWSAITNGDLRKFTIAGAVPTLVSPDDGGSVTSNTFALVWNPVAGATQYRVQTSTVSDFSSTKENVTTVMTEWAPVLLYADGTYYWRVQSLDSGGNVLGISEVRTFVKGPPVPPGDLFTAIAPKRILDSRSGTQVGPFSTPWGAGTQREVTVAGGTTTVPADADAVTLNVTVTQTTAVSYLSIWPKGDAQPTVSSLNWDPGWTVPNSVTVKVGTGGKVDIYNNLGTANVIVDVVGYYTESTGAGFTSVQPTRVLDSRPAFQVGPFNTPWSAGTVRQVTVADGTTVPSDADAVALNVTVTQTNAVSYLSIWPDGQAQPTVSSLNWVSGWTIPNAVTVKVGDLGKIDVYNNQGSAHVIIDVVGYFKAASGKAFHPLSPARILDSRSGTKVGSYSTPWGAGTIRNITVTSPDVPAVPAYADSVLMNMTVTQTTATSYLSVWPNGQTQPTVSSLNWVSGWTIPNAVTAKVGASGQIRIYNNVGSAHVIADVSGWYG